MSKSPKVFVAIPTGSIKEYSLLYMLACLRNLDYNHDNLVVWFAVTMRYPDDESYYTRLKNLVGNAALKFEVNILRVRPKLEEKERWGQYYAVICNLHELRKIFLDGDCDYFWLLGGDNPPPRQTLKRLLKADADVASAMIYQRPHRGRELDVNANVAKDKPYPMFWMYKWTLDDIERPDFEPVLKEELRKMWINIPMFKAVETTQRFVVRNVSFGSGCSLSKRRVQEYVGYYLGEAGYASEDLTYMQYVNALGFSSALDTGVHCLHFDPDGRIY